MPVRVLIGHGQAVFRDALRIALEGAGLDVVAEAADGHEAVALTERLEPDVTVVDGDLPSFDGIETTCAIRQGAPQCKILVLAEDEDLLTLAASVRCGASGYVAKSASVAEVAEAVHALHRGETLIPPVMLGPLLAELVGQGREREEALMRVYGLSRREREVLALVAQGTKTEKIARSLVISQETARTHVQRILSKLGFHSRLEAAGFVHENGLLAHLAPERDDASPVGAPVET